MRITKIMVSNLFGVFNHTVHLHTKDRITIVVAPNGYGKTTILRMLNGLFTGAFSELEHVPFSSFEVYFEQGTRLIVRKATRGEKESKRSELQVSFADEVGHVQSETKLRQPDAAEREFPLSMVEDVIPALTRIGETTWRSLETGETLSFSDVLHRYGHMLPTRHVHQALPSWLKDIQDEVKIRFVESQRLLRPGRPKRSAPSRWNQGALLEPAVAFYSDQVAQEIGRRFSEYLEVSQSLEQTFPVRLVEHLEQGYMTNQSSVDLQTRMSALEDKRRRLREAGLLEKEEVALRLLPSSIQYVAQQVLPLYVSDVEKKLATFDGLLAKIELWKSIMSDKFRFKELTFNKAKGFTFASFSGTPLSPLELSSGEQHMLVLWSELIFMLEQGTLMLIDEPEISLHAAWQQDFVRELSNLTTIADFEVLMATHSPLIISDRWDLTEELRGPGETE